MDNGTQLSTDRETPLIKVSHLGITFGGLRAVNDFSLEMGENELVGLIGPNGAGKTTVFNLLTGVYTPSEGDYYFCGQRMNGKKNAPDRPERHRPYVPEHPSVQQDDGAGQRKGRHESAL